MNPQDHDLGTNSSKEGPRWCRPRRGAVVSGLCRMAATRCGRSVGWVRFGWLAATLVGVILTGAFVLFDHSFLGDGGGAARGIGIATGVLLMFSYPLLALLLPEEDNPRRWDLGSSVGAILLLLVAGQALGLALHPSFVALERGRSGSLGARDVVLLGFFLCSAGFVLLQREAVVRFFRSMHTGVSLVLLTGISVTTGVLIPQIDGFEDPDARVNLTAEAQDYTIFKEAGYQKLPAAMQDGNEQYEAFRWAEGYFIYHLLHLYGIGMPHADLPPRVTAGLERFGGKYGREEEKNRRKQMTAMFTGREKLNEIGAFIQNHEDALWRAFETATILDLNRTYKSSWFATLLGLLGVAVFLSAYRGWSPRKERFLRALRWGGIVAAFLIAMRALGGLSLPWAPDMLSLILVFFGLTVALGSGVSKKVVSLQKIGFFVVHNGLLVLLIGGALSKFTTDRGILNLDSRDPSPRDVYYRFFDPAKKAKLPFGVKLDRFGRKDWLALQVDFPKEEFTSRAPRYTLWKGRTIDLDEVADETGRERPDLRIEVLDVFDHADVGLVEVHESADPDAEPLPLAELLLDEDGRTSRNLLLPMQGDQARLPSEVFRDPAGAWRIAAATGPDPESHFPRAAPGEERVGTLEWSVVGEGDGQPTSVPVVLGETVPIGGGYSLRFRQATSDFRTGEDDDKESHHPLPLARQPMGFTAVWLDVLGPAGQETERRVVFESIDDVVLGRQSGFFFSNVVLRFHFDPWAAPGPPRYVLHWDEHGVGTFLAKDGSRSPTADGKPLTLPGSGQVRVSQLLMKADFESNLTFRNSIPDENGWNPDFYNHGHRGAILRVTRHPGTPEEVSTRVELATSRAGNSDLWFSPDREFVLQFLENSEMMPFEWRSVLTIEEKDNSGKWYEVPLGPERNREIRVNDYFYYRGYRFFQTNADPQTPTYSGIGVVYDPGIPIVLIGMYTIILGGFLAFIVRPTAKGWGKVPKGAAT